MLRVLTFVIGLLLSFNFANAQTKSLAEISTAFNAQDFFSMYQESTYENGKHIPMIVKKKVPVEVAYEIYLFQQDEPNSFEDFKASIWEEKAKEAWEPDSSRYGQITYEDAVGYVEDGSVLQETDKTSTGYKNSVEIFKQLKDRKDLLYFATPHGATPCGDVTLPSVMIIDLKTGEVYNVLTDSSEC